MPDFPLLSTLHNGVILKMESPFKELLIIRVLQARTATWRTCFFFIYPIRKEQLRRVLVLLCSTVLIMNAPDLHAINKRIRSV